MYCFLVSLFLPSFHSLCSPFSAFSCFPHINSYCASPYSSLSLCLPNFHSILSSGSTFRGYFSLDYLQSCRNNNSIFSYHQLLCMEAHPPFHPPHLIPSKRGIASGDVGSTLKAFWCPTDPKSFPFSSSTVPHLLIVQGHPGFVQSSFSLFNFLLTISFYHFILSYHFTGPLLSHFLALSFTLLHALMLSLPSLSHDSPTPFPLPYSCSPSPYLTLLST